VSNKLRRSRFPYGRRVTLTPVGIVGADHDGLLASEPANLTGALIGYARVSTSGQVLDRQTRALTEVGCIRLAVAGHWPDLHKYPLWTQQVTSRPHSGGPARCEYHARPALAA